MKLMQDFGVTEKTCVDCDLVTQSVGDSTAALAYKRVDAKIGWPQKIS